MASNKSILTAAISQINRLHNEINTSARITIQKVIEIGEMLIEAKKVIPYGQFTDWLEGNLVFTVRTANNYIRVAKNKANFISSETVSELTEAYKLLSECNDEETQGVMANEAKTEKKGDNKSDIMEEQYQETDDDDWGTDDDDEVIDPDDVEQDTDGKMKVKNVRPVDGVGVEIPDNLISLWVEAKDMFGRWNNLLTQMTKEACSAAENKTPHMRALDITGFKSITKNLREYISHSRPYAVCPLCGGDGGVNFTCKTCRGNGWLNKMQYAAVPSEHKNK